MPKEFVVFTGPMWSGKTSRLVAVIDRYRLKKSHVICFKPQIDGRYSKTEIATHSGSSIPAIAVSNGEQILQHVYESKAEFVFVDEAFMIDGCADALFKLFKENFPIYVSSIELSANLNTFSEMEKILSYATKVEKCSAVCVECGEDAYLTHRKVHSIEEISVGGADTYEPLCWSCHPITSLRY
jgi:thymidine kinase